MMIRQLSAWQAPAALTLAGISPSPREIDVMRCIAAGMPDKQIAARFGIGLTTVKGHVRSLYAKYDVHSRAQAIAALDDRLPGWRA